MLISAIKILIALAFAYGMVAIYLILPLSKDEERKRQKP
jgi:hypothetical protein